MSTIPAGAFPMNANTTTGTDLVTHLNELAAAALSQHANAARPATITKGGLWTKTVGASDIELYLFDGTTDHKIAAWLSGVFTVGAAGAFLPLAGGTLTGGLSGTTGTFSGRLSAATATITGAGNALMVTGNVGIGLATGASPARPLQVNGIINATAFEIANTPDFYMSNTLPGAAATGISFDNGDTIAFNRVANTMHFGIGGIYQMELQNGGWVIIGPPGATAKGKLTIEGGRSHAIPGYAYLARTGASPYTGDNGGGVTAPVGIYSSERIVAAECDVISDARVKKDISIITEDRATEFLEKVEPVTFRMKEGDDRVKHGFIAQNLVSAGFGGMVSMLPVDSMEEMIGEDGLISPAGFQMHVDYNQVVGMLLAIVKRQQGFIEELHRRVSDLED